MVLKAQEILYGVEKVLFQGEQFSGGREWTAERDIEEMSQNPEIVRAYNLIKSYAGDHSDLLTRTYALARDNASTNYFGGPKEGLEEVRRIALEGRDLSLSIPKTLRERVVLGKLFADGVYIFSAQIDDPKRGCSASICSNCDEPIAYCDTECGVCDYELIQGLPRFEEWVELTSQEKRNLVWPAIIQHRDNRENDWRGIQRESEQNLLPDSDSDLSTILIQE